MPPAGQGAWEYRQQQPPLAAVQPALCTPAAGATPGDVPDSASRAAGAPGSQQEKVRPKPTESTSGPAAGIAGGWQLAAALVGGVGVTGLQPPGTTYRLIFHQLAAMCQGERAAASGSLRASRRSRQTGATGCLQICHSMQPVQLLQRGLCSHCELNEGTSFAFCRFIRLRVGSTEGCLMRLLLGLSRTAGQRRCLGQHLWQHTLGA